MMTRLSAVLHAFSVCVVVALAGFLSEPADAQIGQWAFGQTPDEHGVRITEVLPSDGTIACGSGRITRLDDAANVLWMVMIDGFYPAVVIQTIDGGFAAAGFYSRDNITRYTMLAKLDAAGAVSWTHLYPGTHFSEPCDLIEVAPKSGGPDAAGFVIVDSYDSPKDGLRLPFVIKTKADGSVEWMNRYRDPNKQSPHGEFCFVQLGFDAQGGTHLNLTGRLADGGILGKPDTLLARIEMDGTFVVANTIGFETHTDFGRGLTRWSDDAFLVTGYSKELGEGGGTYLMRVADDFALNWYSGIYGFTGSKEIHQDPNGNALLTGTTTYPNLVENAALIAIDTGTQALAWGMQYGGEDGERGADFAWGPDGYIVFGSTRSFDIFPNQDFYYVKTDFYGRSGCNETEYRPDPTPHLPPEKAVVLNPESIAEVEQFEAEWGHTNYKWRDLCDDPPKPCECVDPPVGMMAWWTLDELVGPIAAESVAGVDGVYVDNPTPTPAMVANGLLFDGTDDYVRAPSSPTVNVPASQGSLEFGSFSIDAWIRIDDIATWGWGPIMEKRSESGGPGYAFYVNDGVLNLALNDGSASMIFNSTQLVPMDEFVHVAVAVNRGTPGEARFFVNGVSDVAIEPMSIMGSLANDAPVWIGAMRYSLAPGSNREYFNGIIDEVEFFDRPLDDSEVIAIYEAQECGKCKIDCEADWDIPFCIDQSKVLSTVTVCNYSPLPATIELSFDALSPPDCGNITGPTSITVLAPGNPVVVPGNTCIDVEISIDRPADMVALYDFGCFEVVLLNLDTDQTNSCMGTVYDRRDLWPDVDDDDVVIIPDVDVDVGFPITNTGLAGGFFEWRAVVYGPNMTDLSDNISINGNEPGEVVVGEMTIPFGETKVFEVTLRASNFEGLSRSDFVLFTRIDNQGNAGQGAVIRPLASFGIKTEIEEQDCIGDITNDGRVDGADLAIVLGSWGECIGCASDLNGDDIVDGADLTLLLGNWGPC